MTNKKVTKRYRGYRIVVRVYDSWSPFVDKRVCVSVYNSTIRKQRYSRRCDANSVQDVLERLCGDARGWIDDSYDRSERTNDAITSALSNVFEDDT